MTLIIPPGSNGPLEGPPEQPADTPPTTAGRAYELLIIGAATAQGKQRNRPHGTHAERRASSATIARVHAPHPRATQAAVRRRRPADRGRHLRSPGARRLPALYPLHQAPLVAAQARVQRRRGLDHRHTRRARERQRRARPRPRRRRDPRRAVRPRRALPAPGEPRPGREPTGRRVLRELGGLRGIRIADPAPWQAGCRPCWTATARPSTPRTKPPRDAHVSSPVIEPTGDTRCSLTARRQIDAERHARLQAARNHPPSG